MKNKLLILVFGIFFLSLVNANVILNPNPTSIETQIGKTINYTISITNNYSFEITDFYFEQLQVKGFIFPNITLLPNQTQNYNVLINTNERFSGNITEIVKFKFWVDLPEPITTREVNISENGIIPNYVVIRNGDTIKWNNLDSITHNLYIENYGQISIAPNSSNTQIFNQLGSFSYYDVDFNIFSNFHATIEVVNRTDRQKAHNPNYDFNWIIDLNSFSQPTNILVNNSQNNYEISYSKSKKGLFTIINIGNNTAEVVTLTSSSDWITFNKNNFDISLSELEWVEYTILPKLTNTSQTNKTYNFEINIKASNSENIIQNIEIFIPYKEITGDIENDFDFAMWLENLFCPFHPCSVQCSPELPQCRFDSNNSLGLGGNISVNYTYQDVYDIKRDLAILKETQSRSDNNYNSLADSFKGNFSIVANDTNYSKYLSQESLNREKERTNITMLIGFLAFLGVLSFFIIKALNKKSEQHSRIGDIFNYSK